MKPRIGMVLGDPCGIGPELVAKLLSRQDVAEAARIAVIGEQRVFAKGQEVAGTTVPVTVVDDLNDDAFVNGAVALLDKPVFDPDSVPMGAASLEAGRYQLDCLALALTLCSEGRLDGFCFAPLNKEAMHMAGLEHDDEQGFFADELDYRGPLGIMNTVGNLWTSRVTSHVAHKDVSGLVTLDSVLAAIRLADGTMRKAGFEKPRLAVAGLNPHAGDGGHFGTEEIDAIGPAIETARAEGTAVEGPFPADTIFLKGRDGTYDAIVTMYHDQGQIAMKLMGFDHGVTVHAGLPVHVTTSAHGSAFDIAGKGVANPDALHEAFRLVLGLAA
jgi:4-hydroxythreonine-4-phosphate dehydrogenase